MKEMKNQIDITDVYSAFMSLYMEVGKLTYIEALAKLSEVDNYVNDIVQEFNSTGNLENRIKALNLNSFYMGNHKSENCIYLENKLKEIVSK